VYNDECYQLAYSLILKRKLKYILVTTNFMNTLMLEGDVIVRTKV